MATALDPFSMFTLTTGPAILRNSKTMVNGVLKRNYLLGRLMRGREMHQIVQGGSQIQDIIYLEPDSNAKFYRADQQRFTYRNQQVGTKYTCDWRFMENDTSWTKHEVKLNEGGRRVGAGAFHQFKAYRDLKLMNLWTSTIHKIEDHLFSAPSATEQEAATGKEPHSILSSVTERSSGLPHDGSSEYSTVQGISVSSKKRWDNNRATYTGGTVSATSFWAAFRYAWTRSKFSALPKYGEFGTPSKSQDFIACSLWGMSLAESLMRSDQDLYLGARSDPAWPHPVFNGTPLVYVDTLDDAEVWTGATGTTLYAEDNGSLNHVGPRYVGINGASMCAVWHEDEFFKKTPPFHPTDEPFKTVLVTDNWYNIVNENRREHFVISPSSDVTGPVASQTYVDN